MSINKKYNLKKFIYIICICVIQFTIIPNIFSQERGHSNTLAKGQFASGLKLGISTSQIYGDNFGGYNKVGASGGAFVTTRLNEKLKFQLELNYSNRGSRDPAKPNKGKFDSYKISTHYLDVPLLLKFWVWKFEFEAGLNNGIFLGHTELDEIGRIPKDQKQFSFTRYELAANAGINIELKNNWFFNTRFHYSILPVSRGGLTFIQGYGLAGGLFNNSILFSINRIFNQK